jgi:hypothetical protein
LPWQESDESIDAGFRRAGSFNQLVRLGVDGNTTGNLAILRALSQ